MLNTAWADDYNPPDWQGDPYTTYQKWVFGDSSTTPYMPDDLSEGHPGVSMVIEDSGPATVWHATDPTETTRTGVWETEDWLEITIQNFAQSAFAKDIWIQLTYKAEAYPDIYAIWWPYGLEYWATLIDQETIAGSEYVHQTWEIWPDMIAPSAETIYIMPGTGTGWVDQIVIDTRIHNPPIPEPATLLLLGLGGLALLRRRTA